MGSNSSKIRSGLKRNRSAQNVHDSIPSIKIHGEVALDFDGNHDLAMTLPLGEVTDEQLISEVARRRLALYNRITEETVQKSYEFGNKLGKGASGEVFLVIDKETQVKYACKKIVKNKTMNDSRSMSTELEILKRLNHKNVITIHEVFESPACFWIIMDLADGGNLMEIIAHTENYTEKKVAKLFAQLLEGVRYLHSHGIVHRDLKLDNILYSKEKGELKIADFGLSAMVRVNENYGTDDSRRRKRYKSLKEFWGTREYFAPELIAGAYGPQADLWSLGCVLFEMLTGEQAFPYANDESDSKFYDRIKRGKFNRNNVGWLNLSPQAKDLIKKLLKTNPNSRLNPSEALAHPFIVGNFDREDTILTEAQKSMKLRVERRLKRAAGKEKQQNQQ